LLEDGKRPESEVSELQDVRRIGILSQAEGAAQLKSASSSGVGMKTHAFKVQGSVGSQSAQY